MRLRYITTNRLFFLFLFFVGLFTGVRAQTADLEIKKAGYIQENNSGNVTRFVLTVRNHGPDAATGVEVFDHVAQSGAWRVPNGMLGDYELSHGSVAWSNQGGQNNRSLTWTIPYIPVDGVAVLIFNAENRYNTWDGGFVNQNTATISNSTTTDPNAANDSDTIAAEETWNHHDVAISKIVDNPTPFVGETVTFAVEVERTSSGGGMPIQVTDKLPPGYAYQSYTASAGTYNPGTGVWEPGDTWSWNSATLDIVATALAPSGQPDEYKNVAVITGKFGYTGIDDDIAFLEIIPQIDPNAVDLSLSLAVDEPTPDVCDEVTFSLTTENMGTKPATGVEVSFALPAGLEYVSSSATTGVYNAGSGVWTIGNMAVSIDETLELTAKVLETGSYTATAEISANENDEDPLNNTDELTLAPDFSAAIDLELSKSVNNSTPDIYENVTFSISVENLGSQPATGVVVTDLLPTGFQFVSATGGATYDSGTGTITWNAGSLGAFSNTSFNITANTQPSGDFTNTATVAANQCESDLNNNTDSVTVTPDFSSAIDLSVTTEVSNTTPNVSGTVTFAVEVQNDNPATATGVVLQFDLADGFVYQSDDSGGSYNPGTGTMSLGSMAPSSSATLEIVAEVQASGPYLSIAKITANEPDHMPLNNVSYTVLDPVGAAVETCDVNAVEAVFEEDFGSGTGTYAGALPPGRTNLIYVEPATYNMSDGEYTLAKNAQDAANNWQDITDSSGDPNGYMMIMNADYEPHEFFRINIGSVGQSEFCVNTTYSISFKAINVNSEDNYDYCTNNEDGLILPEIGYFAQGDTGQVLGAGTSGQIAYNATAQWVEYNFVFTTGSSDSYIDLVLFNIAPGGCGNDLAIDDISVYACMTPPIETTLLIDGQLEESLCEGVSVQLTSTDPPSIWSGTDYQWQYSPDGQSWSDISGATNDTHSIPTFETQDNGHYRLLFAQTGNINSPYCSFSTEPMYLEASEASVSLANIEGDESICVQTHSVFTNTTPDGTWDSSNEVVATIDQNGELTALSNGITTISYTITEGDCTFQTTMEVEIKTCYVPTNPMLMSRGIGN